MVVRNQPPDLAFVYWEVVAVRFLQAAHGSGLELPIRIRLSPVHWPCHVFRRPHNRPQDLFGRHGSRVEPIR